MYYAFECGRVIYCLRIACTHWMKMETYYSNVLDLEHKTESAISKLLVQSHYTGKPTLSLAKCPFCHDQTNSLMELKFLHTQFTQWPYYICTPQFHSNIWGETSLCKGLLAAELLSSLIRITVSFYLLHLMLCIPTFFLGKCYALLFPPVLHIFCGIYTGVITSSSQYISLPTTIPWPNCHCSTMWKK
jgi:hypothetical protein